METMVKAVPTITRDQAKKQFDYWTDKLGLVHTFSFDEMYTYLTIKKKQIAKEIFRRDIMAFENKIKEKDKTLFDKEMIDRVNPLKHTWTDGIVLREITNPIDHLLITRIHRREAPFFLMKGDMSIVTEDGIKRIKAPHYGITLAGTKRIIYTHEECVFITIHATNVKTVKELEDEFFTDDFEEITNTEKDNFIKMLKEV